MKLWTFLYLIVINVISDIGFGLITGKWDDAHCYAWGGILTACWAYALTPVPEKERIEMGDN